MYVEVLIGSNNHHKVIIIYFIILKPEFIIFIYCAKNLKFKSPYLNYLKELNSISYKVT